MESGSRGEEAITYDNAASKRARLQSMLSALLDDPILADVPKKPTITDVDTLINLEQGSAMKLTVVKMDSTNFDVAVLNSSTVKDLKMAVERKTNEIEQGQMGHRHISWRHVWANYCLCYHNEKLLDDASSLSNYGLRNNSKVSSAIQDVVEFFPTLTIFVHISGVHFSPCVTSKLSQKHSRRRKHRFFHGLSKKSGI